MPRKHLLLTLVVLTAGALAFRVFVATRLATDQPDDGRLYAQLATNLLDHRVYSASDDASVEPTYIRVPGYPLFVAAVYRVFGEGNNRAVRVIQATIDTVTCWLVVWLVMAWQRPATPEERGWLMARALALAAVCPFLAIYVATVLTETWSAFLWTLGALAIARAASAEPDAGARPHVLWALAGGIAGAAAMVRPDNGLLVVAALGFLVWIRRKAWTRAVVLDGGLIVLGCCAALAPWTIRNAVVFHAFQPLAPATASLADEFVPNGYITWLRTWVDRGRYVVPFEDSLGLRQINPACLPEAAFDSETERQEVTRLLDLYDHAPAGAFGDEGWEDDATGNESAGVLLTREMDERFAAIARARIARRPLRYYVVLPLKRAASLWIDTHSQFYPFEGHLLPVAALRGTQKILLPLFGLATVIYLAAAVAGGWTLARQPATSQWLVLAGLLVLPRMLLLASIENPEPRYIVEWFPLVCALAAHSNLHATSRLSAPGRFSSPSAPASRTP